MYEQGKRDGPYRENLSQRKISFVLDTAGNPGTFTTMNKYKQVFPAGAGTYTFRLTLPAGIKFQAEESFSSQEDAAFQCDLLKFYVTKFFSLKSSSLLPSLPLALFFSMLRETGIDPAILSDVRFAMSYSTKEMMLNGGHDALAEFAANQKSAVAGWNEPPHENV